MQLPYDGNTRRRIYLVRHGHALGDGENSARYSTDLTLTPRGVREAEAMREFLRAVPFDEAWSSDITRSHETARIILQAHDLALHTSAAYREIAVDLSTALRGEGDIRERLQKFAYDLWRADESGARLFGTGDYFAEYFERVRVAMDELALGATGNTLLLVAHSGFNRAALCWASGAALAGFGAFEQDPCCVNMLDIDIDPAERRIVRKHVRLANFTPLDPDKRDMRLTDSEVSAQQVADLLAKVVGRTG